jgi:hypothetical protein
MSAVKVVLLRLTKERAAAILQECADVTWRVNFTEHLLLRMDERRISTTQVLNCLKHGAIVRGPKKDVSGDWKCTVEWITAGTKLYVGVAIDLHQEPTVTIVLTAY